MVQATQDACRPPLISLEAARKRRAQGDSVFELEVPSLRVDPGTLVALIGDSGCGKSTLLDILALVMAPTQVARFALNLGPGAPQEDVAALWADGAEAAMAALRRDWFGYVLQTGGLLPFLSVRRNIGLPARLKGVAADQRIAAMADRMGLSHCLDRLPEALSIGQRQRAAIVRAIAHQPRLVLADEPTAAVDKTRARNIMDDMEALAREEDVAVVVVTHDVELMAGRCDAVYTFDTTQVSAQITRSVCRPLIGKPRP